MGDEGKHVTPRKHTDESLRTERQNVDEALRERQSQAEHEADLVVARARETADGVLAAARDEADQVRAATATTTATRGREDTAVDDERAAADAALEDERIANRAALARLLPFEREKTDRSLLTERIRADTDLAHRDDFLGIVSHDLRNLLSGIALSTTLMIEQASSSEEGARAVETATRIERYSARMNRLIGDLLDVASIDAGKLAVERSPGDIAAVIAEAIDLFMGHARAKQLTLENQVGEPQPWSFDHDRMIQVLANLITNAIKFTEPGGTIVVTSARTADGVVIAVRDSGKGIPSDKLEAVFERFWQARKEARRGVGLGLYISKCIVEAHGGKIWVESKLEEGSTFSFTIT